jgi:hypothetical protein
MRMTSHWSERTPWNGLIRVAILPAMAIGLCIALPIMLVVAPAQIVYTLLETRMARVRGLSKKGYFGGRRIENKWVYEERDGDSLRALMIDVVNTEPGRWEMFFPTQSQWNASTPEWARDRREEIAHRIAKRYRRNGFHYPSDLRAGP